MKKYAILIIILIIFLFGCIAQTSNIVKSDNFSFNPEKIVKEWTSSGEQCLGKAVRPKKCQEKSIHVHRKYYEDPSGKFTGIIIIDIDEDTKRAMIIYWMEDNILHIFDAICDGKWKQVKPKKK